MGPIGFKDFLKTKVLAPAGAVVGGAVGAAVGGLPGAQAGAGLGLAVAWKVALAAKVDNVIDHAGHKVDRAVDRFGSKIDDSSQILLRTIEKSIDTWSSIFIAGSAMYICLYAGTYASVAYKSRCVSMMDNLDCFFLSFGGPATTCAALTVLWKLTLLVHDVLKPENQLRNQHQNKEIVAKQIISPGGINENIAKQASSTSIHNARSN